MAFSTVAQGNQANANDVQQIIDALIGTAGGGQQFSFNQFNSSSAYALTVRNLDTTNGYALKVTDASDSILLQVRKANVQIGASAASDTLAINANISGIVYIGDSANAGMTAGLTINQGAANNEILALKSSAVAHGMTTDTETDTYGFFSKFIAAGGLKISGYQSGAGTNSSLWMEGAQAAAADTSKAATSAGVVRITAGVKSGTTTTVVGANGNLLTVGSVGSGNTKVIIDAEGDIHCDAAGGAGNIGNIGGNDAGGNASPNQTIAGYNTYDEFEDVELVRLIEVERKGRGLVEHEFDQFLRYKRTDLERLNLAHFDTDGHPFVNYTGLTRLHSGAIWQMWTLLKATIDRLALAEQRLAALPSAN